MLLQTAHYISLSFLTPFATHGVPGVGLVLDWRELAGWTIDDHVHGGGAAYAGGRKINVVQLAQAGGGAALAERAVPSVLGLAFCWLVTSVVEYVCRLILLRKFYAPNLTQSSHLVTLYVNSVWAIYVFVRRPRMVLDFALTLLGVHLIISTYYSGSIPRGLVTWGTYAACAAIMVVFGEQLCVRREMQDGIAIAPLSQDVELGRTGVDTDRNV